MQELISPNTSVPILDESLYIAGQETAIPLIILATAAEKEHPFTSTAFTINSTVNGALCTNCAVGTFEHGVVRTVTSLRQSLELYGIPKFLETSDGSPMHGDARNEYGLLTLNEYLSIGRRALVVRVNVNLDDDINNLVLLWQKRIEDTVDIFGDLFNEYLRNYNESNGYVPLDPSYKTTIDATEFKSLIRQALNARAFRDYSFEKTLFQEEFLRDHSDPVAGYVEVQLDDTRGYVTGDDVTGLDPLETYQINIGVNGYAPNGQPFPDASSVITIDGANAQTYAALIAEMNTELAAAAFGVTTGTEVVATLVNGRIRFTSALTGVSSSVVVTNDSLTSPLFVTTSLPLVVEILEPVDGRGNDALQVYTDFTYTTLNVTDGEFDGLDEAIDVQAGVDPDFDLATATSVFEAAATEYQFTKEFRDFTSLGANDAARRATIVEALIKEVKTNQFIKNELYEHNLIVCPGYPEVTTYLLEHVQSRDVKEEVQVLGSVPMNVAPDGPGGLLEWNAAEGVKNYSVCYHYPHPLQRNVDGKQVLGDSTSVVLKVIAYNDVVGEPWFAPAGLRRGTVAGVDDIGYVTGELGGPTEFVQVHLQEGQRDNLYTSNINPIAFFPTHGIVVWGQKTTQSFASALDRINVSRLVKYIKRGLRKGTLAFVFEQNDRITREQLAATINNFLNIVLMRRGLYDFAVICDDSNNTPERIDRNEMWADVAIKPTKVAEFIYVPVRVVLTSADIGTSRTISLSNR